jgi:pSer/pThr/pTyr-binding forkhead associated (FHA) protein
MWILKTTDESDLPRLTFRVMPGAIKTVGRATGADFVLDAPMVSRLHCRLTATPTGHLEVLDLESTNGTFVNDRRITSAVLAAGDRLRIGRVELVVATAAAP